MTCNETVKLWLEELGNPTTEELRAEIEEVEGTISNERLWAHVDSIHEENIATLVEYLNILVDMTLLRNGTKVRMYDGNIGIIQGNDWETTEKFRDVNYYVYPIDDDINYVMMLAQHIKTID